jgi:hypothetical protein
MHLSVVPEHFPGVERLHGSATRSTFLGELSEERGAQSHSQQQGDDQGKHPWRTAIRPAGVSADALHGLSDLLRVRMRVSFQELPDRNINVLAELFDPFR